MFDSDVLEPSVEKPPELTFWQAPKALNIALLGYRSDPFSGGQGIYLYYLSKALVEAGHQVDVISGEPYPQLDPRVNLIKLPGLNLFQYYPKQWKAFKPSYLLSPIDLREYLSVVSGGFPEPKLFGDRLKKWLSDTGTQYDIIHDNQSLCYALCDLERQGQPIVTTFHHPITRDLQLALDAEPKWQMRLFIKRWYSFLKMQKKVVRKLQHVVTVSDNSRHDIAADFDVDAASLDLIYNGIDTTRFKPNDKVERIYGRILCTASADAPLKGLRYLLKAFALIRNDHPELSLVVIGKPKAGEATDRLIDELALRDVIVFKHGLSNDEMVEQMQSAEMVVCPSLYEGFGLPAGEAMACATPVISSDGGALPEVVGDAGIVVPKANSKALADAIVSLHNDSERLVQLGQYGRERIVKNFSWQVAAREFTYYYYKVMAHADS